MNILKKPIITEKSMQDAAKGWYTFAVNAAANKAEIAKEINKAFAVKVTGVKTMTVKGKSRRAGKQRKIVMSSPWKKAIVALVAGQKIPLFDVTEEKEGHKHA